MRLIDADALKAIYKRNSITKKVMVLDKSPMQHLMDAPTIDAVEVIRCEQCVHWSCYKYINSDFGMCREQVLLKRKNGFCDEGERK